MTRLRIVRTALAFLAAGALGPARAPAQPRGTEPPSPLRQINMMAEQYMGGYFLLRPTEGTSIGLHEYDGLLEAWSEERAVAEAERIRGIQARLGRFDPDTLDLEARVDLILFRHRLDSDLFDLTVLRRWERDPNQYAFGSAFDPLITRSFAPPEDRMRSVIARVKQIPRLLENARRYVKNPPQIFTQLAIGDFESMAGYLENEIPAAFEGSVSPASLGSYREALGPALAALDTHIAWLRNELLPKSHGSFVLGEALYRKMLAQTDMIDLPLDTLLAIGKRELDRLEARYRDAARRIDPKASLREVVERMRLDHPSADSLLLETEALLEEIRSFCIDSRFIDIPSEVRCAVRATPEYAASQSFASLDAPGALETRATESFFNVTLPAAGWDSARVEEHLQGYSRWSLPSVSIHEAYPGHYVHFLYGKRAPTFIRRTMGSYSFAEGWALYTEEALVDHGFRRGDPRVEFGMLRWALVRACRFQVGIRVHARGMEMDEATRFFMEHAGMERANATREAYRAAFDPLYISYTLGAMEIRKLRDDVARSEGGSFDLASFHARILSQGALHVALLRLLLLDDSGPTL